MVSFLLLESSRINTESMTVVCGVRILDYVIQYYSADQSFSGYSLSLSHSVAQAESFEPESQTDIIRQDAKFITLTGDENTLSSRDRKKMHPEPTGSFVLFPPQIQHSSIGLQ